MWSGEKVEDAGLLKRERALHYGDRYMFMHW
jgi:hypothetical protein